MADAPTRTRRMPLAWQHAGFRRLSAAWVFTNLADSALFLVIAVWVKELTGSDSAAAFVFAAFGAPALLAPVLGHVADRASRRLLLTLSNLAMAGVVCTLLLVESSAWLWLVYSVVFVYGTIGYLTAAAQGGILRDLLPDEHLASANGLLSTIDQVLRLIAPVAGTAAYAFLGPVPVIAATALAFLIAGLLTTTVSVSESPLEDTAGTSYREQVAAGFRHLARTPVLGRVTIAIAIAFGATGLVNVAVFPMIEQGLGMDAATIGPLVAIQGLGAIVAGVTAATVIARLGELRVLTIGLGALGLACATLVTQSLAVITVSLLLVGAGVTWVVVSYMTMRQKLTPPRLQGRTGAAANVAISVPQTVLTLLGAGLLAVVDYRLLVLATAVAVVAATIFLLVRSRAASRNTLPDPPVSDVT